MSTNYSIKYYTLCLLLLISGGCWAAAYGNSKVQHYIALSFAAGEANNMSFKTDIQHQLGAGGAIGLGYELQANHFIFGLGAQVNYEWLRDGMDTYNDVYSRVDRENEPVQYGYCHTNYRQQDHMIRMAFPIYFGLQGDYFYALIGASFNLPLWNQYRVTTQMLTQGEYVWGIQPVRTEGINDFSSYGYYANDDYTYSANYIDHKSAHAFAELGSYIPLKKSNKTRLRLGVYCSYGFRLGSLENNHLLNLSKVNLNPATQTQANLKSNIAWEPLNTTNLYSSLPHNIEAGIRLTVLMNVRAKDTKCNCLKD